MPLPVSSQRPNRILVGLMLLVAAAVYANGLTGDFIWDDRNVVVDNARAHGLTHLPELLGVGGGHFGFRMMRDLSYAVDYTIGGLSPVVYHASNLVYHLLCTFLVWVLARRLGAGDTAAFWAGILFGAHPVHVDAVTYISGRRDVLSTLFYLAGLLAFVRYRDAGRRGWLAGAVALGACGVMTKEMAATLPLAWFLYDAWRLAEGGAFTAGARRALARHWRLYGLGGAAAAAFVAYAVVGQHLTFGAGPIGGTWGVHAMSMTVILAHGVRMLWFPINLLIDYQHVFPPVEHASDPRFLAAAAVLLGAIAAAWVGFGRRRTPAFAAHWVWVTYLPVMQIIPHPERFAEHYLYLPSVGAALLAGTGIARLAAAPLPRGRAAVALGTAVVLLFAVRTVVRNRDFAGEIPVFEAALRVHPIAPRVWDNLAAAYAEHGRRDQGIALLTRAMAQTRDPRLTANLAAMLGEEGRWPDALPWLLDAYARYPDDPGLLAKMGQAFYQLGRLPDAQRAYARLLRVQPGNAEAHLGLGNLARVAGQPEAAAIHYRSALRKKPDLGGAWTGLGLTLQAQGDRAGAAGAFRKVLELDPEDGDAWNNLGVLALQDGDMDGAEADFGRAVAVARPVPTAYLNLARLRLQGGDCAGARQALQALAASDAALPADVVASLRAQVSSRCAPGAPGP